MLCMTLGGRASEEVFFGNVSTGAADAAIVILLGRVRPVKMQTVIWQIQSDGRSYREDLSRGGVRLPKAVFFVCFQTSARSVRPKEREI